MGLLLEEGSLCAEVLPNRCFHLRRVKRVELVLAAALLGSDALGALQPHCQIAPRLRIAWFVQRRAGY
jgi:hypothetical protein